MTRSGVQSSQLLVACEEVLHQPVLQTSAQPNTRNTYPGIPALDKKCKTTGNALHLQTAVYKPDNPQNPQMTVTLLHTNFLVHLHSQNVPTYYSPSPIKAVLIIGQYLCGTVKATLCPESLPTDLPSQSPNLDNETYGGQGIVSLKQRLQFLPPHRSLKRHIQMLLHLTEKSLLKSDGYTGHPNFF